MGFWPDVHMNSLLWSGPQIPESSWLPLVMFVPLGASCRTGIQIVLIHSCLNPRMWVSWIPWARCSCSLYFKVVCLNHNIAYLDPGYSVWWDPSWAKGCWPAFLVRSCWILVVSLIPDMTARKTSGNFQMFPRTRALNMPAAELLCTFPSLSPSLKFIRLFPCPPIFQIRWNFPFPEHIKALESPCWDWTKF